MKGQIFAAVQFEIKLFHFFSTGLNGSLIIFIRTYTVNYRNALDRLRVRVNIILLILSFAVGTLQQPPANCTFLLPTFLFLT